MGKYFGTDGIRGVAGEELTAGLAYRAGFALAYVLGGEKGRRPLVLIGRDTRISGSMLEAALTAGLCSAGADVISLGVLPTPAVAHMTVKIEDASAGIVISASHNPYEHNGIKVFGHDGYKLTDQQESAVEEYIDAPPANGAAKTGSSIGRVLSFSGSPADSYTDFIVASAPGSLSGMRILVDCANGASSETAPVIFKALGASADFLSISPDGVNINEKCGSTHMQALMERMSQGGYDAGVAFDGDADRCLLTDERGELIDGDKIIGILAERMKSRGQLRGGAVGTIMSNLGLVEYLGSLGIEMAATKVGDRYVLEEMKRNGHNIGGEQSGHVILSDYCTTGDGEMTAVHMLSAIKESGKKASELAGQIQQFPQVIVNVDVPNSIKAKVSQMESVRRAEEKIKQAFGSSGRIVIRPSGTEAKVRVMVEGRDEAAVREMAETAARAIKEEAAKIIV